MGCDMVVALARATMDGQALFGHNSNRPGGEGQALVRTPGRDFAPGEAVRTQRLALPQVRHTCTVVASRSAGLWGYQHGVNEHGVAVGVTSIRTRLRTEAPGLTGPDLVRLALERSASARQAADAIADLVARHGQGDGPDSDGEDGSFLIADAREAFALEACGGHWAEQSVGEVRAVSDVCHLRQDWDRISRGLAALAIERGWWPENGSKLDFAGALAREGGDNAAALRRWGRATLLLEQQNGQIDLAFLRRLLADHAEPAPRLGPPHLGERTHAEDAGATDVQPDVSLCRHGRGGDEPATVASLVAQLGPVPVAWCAFGPPCSAVFFPIVPEGDLPAAFQAREGSAGSNVWRQVLRLNAVCRRDPARSAPLREALAGLQERFDLEARSFVVEAAALKQGGALPELRRLAGSLMQHNLERFEDLFARILEEARRPAYDPSLVFAG